jgi:copper transport protein
MVKQGASQVIHLEKIFLAMVAVAVLFFSIPELASAHAYIVKSNPSENEILSTSPDKVSIEFDEMIQASFYSMQVLDMKGNKVSKSNGKINATNAKILETNLKKELPKGVYSINWRIVSSDGHPIDGVIPFQIGEGSPSKTLLKSKTIGYVPKLDLIIIRWIQYICGAVFVGLGFFYLTVYPREKLQNTAIEKRYKGIMNISYVFLWLSILISLPMQTTIEVNVSWLNAFDVSLLRDMAMKTLFGKVWIVEVILLLLLLLTIKRTKKFFWWTTFVLGACLFLAKAITSHAVSTKDLLVAIEFDFLHLLSASVWIGSLVAMVILLPLKREEEGKIIFQQMIRKFFTWGKICVFLLAISGVYLGLKYVPTWHALFNTNYGRVLTIKMVLFIIMLVLAWMNSLKRRQGEIRKTLWGEVAAGIMVLGIVVILTNLPTASSSMGPFKKTNQLENKDEVTLKIGPNVIGQNTFEVILKDKSGKPLKDLEQVSLTFTSRNMDMGDNTVAIQKTADGKYKIKGMYLNMAGPWQVHVHALTKSLEAIDADFNIVVGSQ